MSYSPYPIPPNAPGKAGEVKRVLRSILMEYKHEPGLLRKEETIYKVGAQTLWNVQMDGGGLVRAQI